MPFNAALFREEIMLDVPATADALVKELHEQRALYRALARSIEDMNQKGVEPPGHWQTVHMALSDHFVALSQGR
jgi:hypothetical protein